MGGASPHMYSSDGTLFNSAHQGSDWHQQYLNHEAQLAADKAASPAGKLAAQILGQNTSSKWSGEGFGSAQANAADMARILQKYGITDINQFGQRAATQTVPVTEQFWATYADEYGTPFLASAPNIKRDAQGNLVKYIPSEYDSGPGYSVPLSPSEQKQVTSKVGYLVDNGEDGSSLVELTPAQQNQVKNGQLAIPTGGTEYINKATGQVIDPSYDRAGGQIWSGTFAGNGSTGYGVQFDAQGNPYFYTQFGGSTNDLAGLLSNPVINFVATAAAAATGGPLGVAALSAAKSIANGGDISDALESAAKGAATAYVGGQVAQGVGNLGDQLGAAAEYGTGVGSQQSAMLAAQNAGMGTIGDVAGNIAGNVAAQQVVTGGKADPLASLISSGVNAGTSALTSEIPGFSDLSPVAQKAVNNAVSAELQGKDPTQGLINSALSLGLQAVKDYSANATNTPTEDQVNQNNQSLVDTLAQYETKQQQPGIDEFINQITGAASDTYTPTTDYGIGADYGLFGGSTAAPSLEDMGGGQGLQVAPVDETQNVGFEPIDYGLDTTTPFDELQMPTTPNVDSMGGGQGLTVPVAGGTLTETGLIPTGTAPNLGDPDSFINKPAPGADVSAAVKAASDAADKASAQQKAAASAKAASDKAAADKAAAAKQVSGRTAAATALDALLAQQAQQNALMQMMSGNPELANIKSNTNLFGAIPGMEPPASSAQQQDTPDTSWDQQFATGGHVDDFSVDALLHILRS